MTRVISVIQSKGGTGKTTLSVMLAEAIRQMGYTVAIADGDPQQSATRWATKVKDFPFPIESVHSSSDFSGVVRKGNNPDFLIVDTPPGGLAFITESAEAADLVLLPTGVSPMDIDRTQVTLSWLIEMGTPTAVVLSNVDRRESF